MKISTVDKLIHFLRKIFLNTHKKNCIISRKNLITENSQMVSLFPVKPLVNFQLIDLYFFENS